MPPSVMSLPPATIELRRSRTLCAALIGLGCGAGLAVGLSDLPSWAAVLVPLLLWWAWPAPPRWGALVLSASGATLVGPEAPAQPLDLQVRGPLAVLTLRVEARIHRLILTLRADERRRLVLWRGRAPREAWLAHV